MRQRNWQAIACERLHQQSTLAPIELPSSAGLSLHSRLAGPFTGKIAFDGCFGGCGLGSQRECFHLVEELADPLRTDAQSDCPQLFFQRRV